MDILKWMQLCFTFQTFLLKVVGLEDEKSIGSTSDSFLLLSMVPAEIYGTEDEEEVDKAMSFLNIVLTMIYMGGGPLDAGNSATVLEHHIV